MKILIIALIAAVLSQSCRVYQNTPISLSEASIEQRKVRVSGKGEHDYYKKIVFEDSLYYGISGKEKILITPSEISNVYLKDRKKSILRTSLLVVGVCAGGLFVAMLIALAMNDWEALGS